MSQNDPGDYQRNILDSDVDLNIAHPSPGAEIYSRSSSVNLPSARGILLVLLFIGAAVGGTYYVAYNQGLAEGQRSLPPVVLAENTPIKVPAEQVPGGVAPKPDDLNIYGVMRGDRDNGAAAIPSSPADNANGSIESLIAQTDDPFQQPAADDQLPPGNSITVLRDSDAVKVSPPRPELNRAPRAATPAVQAAKPAPQPQAVAKATPQPAPKPAPKPAAAAKPKPVAVQAADSGTFMVQLAASRSRALARGVYANLQKNYTDALGRRDPLILRVDLGDKGIYYRVNVPGFDGRTAAANFCADLKKRGQDCLVRKQP